MAIPQRLSIKLPRPAQMNRHKEIHSFALLISAFSEVHAVLDDGKPSLLVSVEDMDDDDQIANDGAGRVFHMVPLGIAFNLEMMKYIGFTKWDAVTWFIYEDIT